LFASREEIPQFFFFHFGNFHLFEFVSDFGFPAPPGCVHRVSAVQALPNFARVTTILRDTDRLQSCATPAVTEGLRIWT
jgi:hypothetical protein